VYLDGGGRCGHGLSPVQVELRVGVLEDVVQVVDGRLQPVRREQVLVLNLLFLSNRDILRELKGTLIKKTFFVFSAVWSALGFEVSKKCKYKQQNIFCKNSIWVIGYHKTQNLMQTSNPLKKMQEHSPKRSYRPKTFAHSNSQKLYFSVTFR
jgi:hypothetical protein